MLLSAHRVLTILHGGVWASSYTRDASQAPPPFLLGLSLISPILLSLSLINAYAGQVHRRKMSARPERVSPRKLKIERDLKEMNHLLMVMIQKPDSSVAYQKNIIFLLRALAAIRERMLANEAEDPSLDAAIQAEIQRLEAQARTFIDSAESSMSTAERDSTKPCQGPQA
jgi:hypothetical protein